jgi:ABC-type uncharacterized transport system permease subunit
VATIVGCALCGIGGVMYVLGYGGGQWSTNNDIEAIGWLAVALVIFSSWKPIHLIWGSIVFGILFWAYNYLPHVVSFRLSPAYPGELLKMLPYIVTIIVLVVNSAPRRKRRTSHPLRFGVSYFREER